MKSMNSDINEFGRVLITKEQIQQRVKELGEEISKDFKGQEIVVIGVLKGSFVFMADLVRHISIPISLDFITASSYGHGTTSSGVVTLKKDTDKDVTGKNVLIVEDIIDTGLTLTYIKDMFLARNAKKVSICSALDKPSRRHKNVDIKVDYKGFEIPDEFVVGYGLDYDEYYRNIPEILVLKPEIYENN